MGEVVDLLDWRGRAMRAEKELERQRVANTTLRATLESRQRYVDELVNMLRRFCAVEECYYGGGEYAQAPAMTRHEIAEECARFLRDRVD
jgi:hypothetical protein